MSSCSTSGWIDGPTWIALQPVPTRATRFPARSTSWSHSAVWKAGPSKLSSPGIGGTLGCDNCPQAVIRMSASCGPALVSRTHFARSSSKRALFTSVEVRTLSSTPLSRATCSRYSWISAWGA